MNSNIYPAINTPAGSMNYAGLVSLCVIARFHEVAADPANLAHQWA